MAHESDGDPVSSVFQTRAVSLLPTASTKLTRRQPFLDTTQLRHSVGGTKEYARSLDAFSGLLSERGRFFLSCIAINESPTREFYYQLWLDTTAVGKKAAIWKEQVMWLNERGWKSLIAEYHDWKMME